MHRSGCVPEPGLLRRQGPARLGDQPDGGDDDEPDGHVRTRATRATPATPATAPTTPQRHRRRPTTAAPRPTRAARPKAPAPTSTDTGPTSGEPTLGTTMGAETTAVSTSDERAGADRRAGRAARRGRHGRVLPPLQGAAGPTTATSRSACEATYDYWGDCRVAQGGARRVRRVHVGARLLRVEPRRATTRAAPRAPSSGAGSSRPTRVEWTEGTCPLRACAQGHGSGDMSDSPASVAEVAEAAAAAPAGQPR